MLSTIWEGVTSRNVARIFPPSSILPSYHPVRHRPSYHPTILSSSIVHPTNPIRSIPSYHPEHPRPPSSFSSSSTRTISSSSIVPSHPFSHPRPRPSLSWCHRIVPSYHPSPHEHNHVDHPKVHSLASSYLRLIIVPSYHPIISSISSRIPPLGCRLSSLPIAPFLLSGPSQHAILSIDLPAQYLRGRNL
ncbi:hypothetical protein SISNIDRAFT_488145 [Sistotremastrum niveocremeum HHB9708]|uniref:Uncharacterized protein n=1 Tax=Sistotremastrum niveocremeum HHB9708 TaxID=1314777 RepID=A0A164RHS1_9AGAM|nr:hypothetical protein SISNIDRAFT_488145 [Sistotremastrum niveocremeum HHB9708]